MKVKMSTLKNQIDTLLLTIKGKVESDQDINQIISSEDIVSLVKAITEIDYEKFAFDNFCSDRRWHVSQNNPSFTGEQINSRLMELWEKMKTHSFTKKYFVIPESTTDEVKEVKAKEVKTKEAKTKEVKAKTKAKAKVVKTKEVKVKEVKVKEVKVKEVKAKSTKPKRGKSSYLFFCQEMRSSLKISNPEIKGRDFTKLLGVEWKKISTKEEGKKYINMANQDKNRYLEEMKKWVPSD